MASLNRNQLKELADVRIPDNQSKKITAANVREQIKDLIESSYNKAEDEVGLNEYNSGLTYKAGAVCILAEKIYQANKTTQGAFKSADRNEIAVDEDLVAAVASLTDALTTKEEVGVAHTLITALETTLKDEVAVDGDTLNKLRTLISTLRTDLTTEQEKVSALQALAASDDPTLDTVQDIVTFIKANKSLIDSVVLNKVDKASIVDNLLQETAGKVLDAHQGKVLKDMIEALPTGGDLPVYSTTETISLTGTQAPVTEDFTLVDGVVNADNTITFNNFNWTGFKLVYVYGYGAAQTDFTITVDGSPYYYFGQAIFAYPETIVTIACTRTDASQPFELRMQEGDLTIASGSVWSTSATIYIVQNPVLYRHSVLTVDAANGINASRTFGSNNAVVKAGDNFGQLSYSATGTGITNVLAGAGGRSSNTSTRTMGKVLC